MSKYHGATLVYNDGDGPSTWKLFLVTDEAERAEAICEDCAQRREGEAMYRNVCIDCPESFVIFSCAECTAAGEDDCYTEITLDLVAAVRNYAEQHYDDGGWDVIVECCDDQWIADTIATSGGTWEAVMANVWSDRQADARNSAF